MTARALEVHAPELEAEELRALEKAEVALYGAFVGDAGPKAEDSAIRAYLNAKALVARRLRPFGLVNDRFYMRGDVLLVPYIADASIVLRLRDASGLLRSSARRFAAGQIYTDALLCALAEFDGARTVDLEHRIFVVDAGAAETLHIVRIRDIVALLERVNATANRNEAVYWLRQLVARLCNLDLGAITQAKNLQPELAALGDQMSRLLDGPLARRLQMLMRILVRNLAMIVGKPNLIDRLWNDAIRLAEVEIRGSRVVTEIRRTAHHALGRRTLELTRAYLAYLDNGDTAALAKLGYERVSEADERARAQPETPRALVARIASDLERLLGTEETFGRIDEWRHNYEETLLRCESGRSLSDEVEATVEKGLRDNNRWSARHHVAELHAKACSLALPEHVTTPFVAVLEQIRAADTPTLELEAPLRQHAAALLEAARAQHAAPLLDPLERVVELYRESRYYETFRASAALRRDVQKAIARGGFAHQRRLLYHVDCLLEELGYLALRHIASGEQERAETPGAQVDVMLCIELAHRCIDNLPLDGLTSQVLLDFAAVADEPGRTVAELLDLLDAMERAYHRVRQRVTVPFERMQEKLRLDDEELRHVLANMQRYMHDLNSMVNFCNHARQALRQRAPDEVLVAHDPPPQQPEADAHQVIHLCERSRIGRHVAGAPGHRNLRGDYGGKGSGLMYISHLNIPTRHAFVLPATIPRARLHERDDEILDKMLRDNLDHLQQDVAREGRPSRFGDASDPLLLSVRGGSVFSMPGILSTVVFVGMNDTIVEALANDGPWRAYDSYRRFIDSFANAVWGVDVDGFGIVEATKKEHGVRYKRDLPWEAMRAIAERSKDILREEGYGELLERALADPMWQLQQATRAVFRSWDRPTAQRFREIKGRAHSWQTPCIVQEMAFGNHENAPVAAGMDETRASLTGVVTGTYASALGERRLRGEFKFSAAGDDLVAGVTVSRSIRDIDEMPELMPMLDTRLRHVVAKLRRLMGTDQEIELTVERGVLAVLQTRSAVTPADRHRVGFLDAGEPITRGLGVCGGAFRGLVAFDDEDLEVLRGIDLATRDDVDGVLVVLENPTPADIPTIISAHGLLTAKGGSTSHAAVAANGIEEREFFAVMSAEGLRVDHQQKIATLHDESGRELSRIRRGDVLSIDGTSGDVWLGSRALEKPHQA
ncbi:MAG: hypothetical protein KC503_44270 [Myxococcales bacterium]|nr:hypothetical protein [Myxococcales bacterium]